MSTYETTSTTAKPLPKSNSFSQTTPKMTFPDKPLHGVRFRDLLKNAYDDDDDESDDK